MQLKPNCSSCGTGLIIMELGRRKNNKLTQRREIKKSKGQAKQRCSYSMTTFTRISPMTGKRTGKSCRNDRKHAPQQRERERERERERDRAKLENK